MARLWLAATQRMALARPVGVGKTVEAAGVEPLFIQSQMRACAVVSAGGVWSAGYEGGAVE